MPISGTVPKFDYGTNSITSSGTVVAVTGEATGLADGSFGGESLPDLFQRWANLLSVSGTLTTTPAGLQGLTASELSGVRQVQRELAFRVGDLADSGGTNTARLGHAQAALAASGEVQFGT